MDINLIALKKIYNKTQLENCKLTSLQNSQIMHRQNLHSGYFL